MSVVSQAANRFAVDLHAILKSQGEFSGENLFYSPTSLSIAFGMMYNGASGSTAQEIAKGFHWDEMKPGQVHEDMKTLNAALNSPNTTSIEVCTANRLFLQNDLDVSQKFTECCKHYYDAETALVDYKKNSEGARILINEWVEGKTNKKIQGLIPSGTFTPLTRATLVNAIYFKGIWEKQFKKRHSFPSNFFISQNQEVKIEMMFQRSKFRCCPDRNLGCHLLEMPYAGGELSMVVILPDDTEGLSTLEDKLTYDALNNAITSVTTAHQLEVEVSLPKFKMTSQFALEQVMQLMGMVEMFDEVKADFSGITQCPENLFVSKVIHKAFVDVNEEGTEAAAATAVVMRTRCAIMRPTMSFVADHPFLFVIRHSKSKAILFLGRVVKPDSSK